MSDLADQIDALLRETVECRPGILRWLVGGEARRLLDDASSAIAHLEAQLQEAQSDVVMWHRNASRRADDKFKLQAEVDRLMGQQDALLAALVRAEGSES